MINIKCPMRVIYKFKDYGIRSYVCEFTTDRDRVLELLNAYPDKYEVITIESLMEGYQND